MFDIYVIRRGEWAWKRLIGVPMYFSGMADRIEYPTNLENVNANLEAIRFADYRGVKAIGYRPFHEKIYKHPPFWWRMWAKLTGRSV